MSGVDDLPLFRSVDPPTSKRAGAKVRPKISPLQAAVIAAYRKHGPMNARECESLPEFRACGFSTVRKRISELARATDRRPAQLESIGERDGLTLYQATCQEAAA